MIVPLGMPPPRPSRRETRSKLSTASSTELKSERLRPVHTGRQRSMSSPPPLSPSSPGVPVFSNADAVNDIPISKRSRSLGRQRHSPHVPVHSPSPTIRPQSQTRTHAVLTRSKSQTSLISRDAKGPPPLQVSPSSHVVVSSAQSSPSLRHADVTDGHSRRKLRLKTSMGALGRLKSMIGSARSASHTPTSSASHSAVSPQSEGVGRGGRSTLRGISWEDGEMPPMPFTSTAFAFKEISPMSPLKGIKLTEGEREDMWNALLERSERAGGTLTVALDQLDGP